MLFSSPMTTRRMVARSRSPKSTHSRYISLGSGFATTQNLLSQVDLTVDLVMYLLRQGEYNDQGDIAVLCAYLGQLQRVRAALRSLKVTVAIDERDEDQLVKQGLQDEDETPAIEEVAVTKHVR
jgi:hypothetical protein